MRLSPDRARALTTLHTLLAVAPDLDHVLEAVTHAAVEQVPGTAHATLVLTRTGNEDRVAGSDPVTAQRERADQATEGGLASEALHRCHRVLVRVAEPAGRPDPAGLRSVAAFPRQISNGVHVALTLYAESGYVWDTDAIILAEEFTDEAADAVRLRLRDQEHAAEAAELTADLASRGVVERAVGAIVATSRCTPDEARDILRRSSEELDVDLVDAAAAVIQEVSGGAPTAPAPFVGREPHSRPVERRSSGRHT
ncbi:GAF and ANTAR domain-containing protein [Cellulomonas sp. 179-A 4D5 NHS]|uniref:GAF and ANTAR domain-containing protein n=1 Tax=Cellulomonas sp. 179-A 4D5 NHS TaxID=3142378 RepID=UPI0039A092C2